MLKGIQDALLSSMVDHYTDQGIKYLAEWLPVERLEAFIASGLVLSDFVNADDEARICFDFDNFGGASAAINGLVQRHWRDMAYHLAHTDDTNLLTRIQQHSLEHFEAMKSNPKWTALFLEDARQVVTRIAAVQQPV